MFIRDISLWFSSLVMPLCGFDNRITLPSQKCLKKYTFCFYPLKNIVENWYDFFPKYFVELTSRLWGRIELDTTEAT